MAVWSKVSLQLKMGQIRTCLAHECVDGSDHGFERRMGGRKNCRKTWDTDYACGMESHNSGKSFDLDVLMASIYLYE